MDSGNREDFALLLRSQDHGESDKILTFYCQHQGKVSAIAKGANKSQKRFVNKLEPFSFLKIYYRQSRPGSLLFLQEAELHNSFIQLRKNYRLYGCGSVILEALLAGTAEHQPDENLFSLALWALHLIDSTDNPEKPVILFLIKFFTLLGYRPHLSCCSSCGVITDTKSIFHFDLESGGLVCQKCSGYNEYKKKNISLGTLRLIEECSDRPLSQLARTGVSPLQIREAMQLFLGYGRQIFQRELNSWRGFGDFLVE